MDFLDPKLKRLHKIRLFIGYGLMGVLITMATAIIVFQAYGFDVDRETGEVIQNGLVFVDSAPDDATVFFNNKEQKDKTNNRFSLPSARYDLRIQKDGYHDWNRNFELHGGEVERYTYPMMIPTDLERREVQSLDTAPGFVTQSPDRRWVLASTGKSLTNFTEYDLNTLSDPDENPATRTFSLPTSLFTATGDSHLLELVEWSDDNKHALIKHTFGARTEFVVISRDQPATSVNINIFLGQNPASVVLRDKKFDEWFIYNQQGGVLQTADAKKAVTTVLNGVTAFKTHDDDTILYSQATTDGKSQRISLLMDNETHVIKEVANGPVYLEIARFDGNWYVVAASDAEQKTYIYRDPVSVLQRRNDRTLVPRSVLKSNGPVTNLTFSQNTRFIATQSGQHFEVFDAEANENFTFDLTDPIDAGSKVTWMDGHRLVARSQNKSVIFDFDGMNKHALVTSVPVLPVIFDRDYTVLYSVEPSGTKASLASYQLRLEGDK